MFKNGYVNIICILVLILIFPSCSKYTNLLKSTDTQLKFNSAVEYFNEEDYARAVTLFEQLMPIFRGTEQAEEMAYYRAKCYFGMKNYIEAGYHFKMLTRSYPKSKNAEDAEFQGAYCYFLLSPNPSLDQTNTHNAINALKLFIIKYPGSEKAEESFNLIGQLENKLSLKAFQNARLYYDMGEYKASIVALKNCLLDYPDSEYREEVLFLVLKSNFILADNSIIEKRTERFQTTVDEYYSFIDEFP